MSLDLSGRDLGLSPERKVFLKPGWFTTGLMVYPQCLMVVESDAVLSGTKLRRCTCHQPRLVWASDYLVTRCVWVEGVIVGLGIPPACVNAPSVFFMRPLRPPGVLHHAHSMLQCVPKCAGDM